jgi:hypothetical protein
VLTRIPGPGGQRRDVNLLGVVAVDPVPARRSMRSEDTSADFIIEADSRSSCE